MPHATTLPARLAGTAEDYARLGTEPHAIKPWEDGMRTDGASGTFEWWYFDAHLDDGAKLVVVFQTKDFANPGKPLAPMIRIDLTLPDGTTANKLIELPAETFTASKEACDVRIGDNRFTGDLNTYTIHARADQVEVDVTLTGQVPAWRPDTGFWLFGDSGEHFFAWLPSVPQGHVEVTYSVAGDSHTTTGHGYHDHNWGNASMLELMHHWYWARGTAGPYAVIAAVCTTADRYGYTDLPIFMLAHDGKLIAEDSTKIIFEPFGRYTDTETGKPVDNVTRYTYTDGSERYIVTFSRHTDVAIDKLVDSVKGPKKALAKIAGFDGAYLRFAGELRIECYLGEQLQDVHTDEALWELMYFAKARP